MRVFPPRWVPRSRRSLLTAPLLTASFLALALNTGCGGENGGEGDALAASFVALGEDLRTETESWIGELPPDFAQALTPGLSDDDTDRISLPVHPDGDLIGSIRTRGADGERTYFLTYRVAADDRAVERTLLEQLDASPWQVTGGQSNEQVSAVQFASTTSGDILGTAVLQPLVSVDTLSLRLLAEDGAERTVEIPRRAPLPLLPVRVDEGRDGLVVRAVDPLGRDLGIEVGETLVRIGEVEVATLDDVVSALNAVRAQEPPLTSIVYIVQVAPPVAPTELPFALPPTRALPPGFPVEFLIDDSMVVLTHQWSEDPGIGVYTATVVSTESSADVLDRLREAFQANPDWSVVSDQAVGFATQLEFTDAAEESLGSLSVDLFPDDQDLTMVLLQVQVVR